MCASTLNDESLMIRMYRAGIPEVVKSVSGLPYSLMAVSNEKPKTGRSWRSPKAGERVCYC